MNSYTTGSDCWGWNPLVGRYQRFETDDEYARWYRDVVLGEEDN